MLRVRPDVLEHHVNVLEFIEIQLNLLEMTQHNSQLFGAN